MSISIENILLVGSVLLFLSVLAGRTSNKYGIPTLILFLAVGMLAGSEGIGGIYFDSPGTAQFVGIVALNFILFSGGLDTSWKSVRPIVGQGLILSTLGVILTAAFLGFFVYLITDFTIYESLLLGSIVSSTDAAAVFSILRSRNIALKDNLRPTLEFESGSNDPMAYVLTIAFLTLVVNQDQSFYSIIPIFFQQMILGGIAGFLFGRLSKSVINRIKIGTEGLYPVLVIALMFITFSMTDFVGGNGFLAIYLAGMYLGNHEFIHKKTILQMFDGLAWLMQIVLFLTLGLLIFPSQIIPILGTGIVISLFLIIVARPLSVMITLLPFKMPRNRRLYISWVGLRGAVPIVFATYPLLAGIDKAEMIFSIVFFISVTSVLIQGTTLTVVAKWLRMTLPENEKVITETDRVMFDIPKLISRTLSVKSDCSALEKQIVDLDLPTTAEIVLIQRGSLYLKPSGATVIKADDILTVLAESEKDFEEIDACLNS